MQRHDTKGGLLTWNRTRENTTGFDRIKGAKREHNYGSVKTVLFEVEYEIVRKLQRSGVERSFVLKSSLSPLCSDDTRFLSRVQPCLWCFTHGRSSHAHVRDDWLLLSWGPRLSSGLGEISRLHPAISQLLPIPNSAEGISLPALPHHASSWGHCSCSCASTK